MMSTDRFVLSEIIECQNVVRIDVKRDTTSKESMISSRWVVQTEIFPTKLRLFIAIYLLFCKRLRIEARCLETW